MATVSRKSRSGNSIDFTAPAIAGSIGTPAPVNDTPAPAVAQATAPASSFAGTPGIGPGAAVNLDKAKRNAFMWRTIIKAAEGEFCREALPAGYSGVASLTITGHVDGIEIQPLKINAVGTVAHDGEQASSATPEPDKLIAYLLGKMNEATRNAALRDLPGLFAANDCQYPDVDATVAEASKLMLSKLRGAKRVSRKGNVSIKCDVGFAE